MGDLLRELDAGGRPEKDDLVELISTLNPKRKQRLFDLALVKKRQYYGEAVYLRGLIEFSNYCRQDCLYCGIRRSNGKPERYRLGIEEIMSCCDRGYRQGFRTFVLQSGEDIAYSEPLLAGLIRSIKRRYPDAAVTLSVGERKEESYRAWYEAGADRFLMRHETASPRLYRMLHPTSSFENRMRCLRTLKDIGYQVGAGFMVGLPGQTIEDLADDLLFLHEFQPDMIGIGPFIPHRDTPLRNAPSGTLDDTLVMVALARLIVPDSLIPATTAVGTIDPYGREAALKVGANVLMPNLSPLHTRERYTLYDGKICTGEDSAVCMGCTRNRIASAGFAADMGKGDSPRPRRPRILQQ